MDTLMTDKDVNEWLRFCSENSINEYGSIVDGGAQNIDKPSVSNGSFTEHHMRTRWSNLLHRLNRDISDLEKEVEGRIVLADLYKKAESLHSGISRFISSASVPSDYEFNKSGSKKLNFFELQNDKKLYDTHCSQIQDKHIAIIIWNGYQECAQKGLFTNPNSFTEYQSGQLAKIIAGHGASGKFDCTLLTANPSDLTSIALGALGASVSNTDTPYPNLNHYNKKPIAEQDPGFLSMYQTCEMREYNNEKVLQMPTMGFFSPSSKLDAKVAKCTSMLPTPPKFPKINPNSTLHKNEPLYCFDNSYPAPVIISPNQIIPKRKKNDKSYFQDFKPDQPKRIKTADLSQDISGLNSQDLGILSSIIENQNHKLFEEFMNQQDEIFKPRKADRSDFPFNLSKEIEDVGVCPGNIIFDDQTSIAINTSKRSVLDELMRDYMLSSQTVNPMSFNSQAEITDNQEIAKDYSYFGNQKQSGFNASADFELKISKKIEAEMQKEGSKEREADLKTSVNDYLDFINPNIFFDAENSAEHLNSISSFQENSRNENLNTTVDFFGLLEEVPPFMDYNQGFGYNCEVSDDEQCLFNEMIFDLDQKLECW
ncbi:hypothetical protein AYI68_g8199 [Smittium mucronatum]|uniref:Uncharacterized protein n=1 Tax=Smittium mucronatum TaxID=133383 RepID=A0A1R0GLK0_9FUNG|nr:hypothetical protein AYI68_g8199 [Smittium mucronatum]